MEFKVFTAGEARTIDPHGVPWPEGTTVLYAIEEGQIVGRSAFMPLPHVEGTWVDEAHRGSTLAFRLVRNIEKLAAAGGRSHVFAFALDEQPEIAGLLERDGWTKFPATVYQKELEIGATA